MSVSPEQLVEHMPVAAVAAISDEHFDEILARKPVIVLLGTGAQLRFPDYTLMARILQTRTGFEVMDTPAACRTYNILVEEGRQVAAAIIL